MRLLIYGAGVIGCWYAVLFSKAGYDTTIYQTEYYYIAVCEKSP